MPSTYKSIATSLMTLLLHFYSPTMQHKKACQEINKTKDFNLSNKQHSSIRSEIYEHNVMNSQSTEAIKHFKFQILIHDSLYTYIQPTN